VPAYQRDILGRALAFIRFCAVAASVAVSSPSCGFLAAEIAVAIVPAAIVPVTVVALIAPAAIAPSDSNRAFERRLLPRSFS